MNNDQFIKALRKALSGMDKESREDVVQEIESHGADSGDNLFQQFGDPKTLAQQYTDGEVAAPKASSPAKKVASIGKKILMGLGILVVLLIALGFFLKWKFSGDAFNYADEAALEQHTRDLVWEKKNVKLPLKLRIYQSQVQLFWHQGTKMNWSCKGKEPELIDGSFHIKQARCMLFMPPADAQLAIEQAQVVIAKPLASLDIDMVQAELRIAEEERQYRYEMTKDRSYLEPFSSHDSAEQMIKIKAKESTVKHYVFSD